MIKDKKIFILITLAILFLSLQWFLVTQRPFLLSLAIVLASIFVFKKITDSWIFTILPVIWLFSGLSILYFFPGQGIVLAVILGYLAGLWLAMQEQYAWWQIASILNVYFLSSLVWFFVLAQALDFLWGLVIISFGSSLIFLQSIYVWRRAGELVNMRNKNQIAVISLGVLVGFIEVAWAISFLPFGYFILGALFTAVFSVLFNIINAYYKNMADNETVFKNFLLKNIMSAFVFMAILIIISPWLPQK